MCKSCAAIEQVPVIRKATQDQINKSNVHYSVRERMERMSNNKPKIIYDQAITHKNLSKLNFPQQRKDQQGLVENYDWKIKTARRRAKLSIAQLALTSGVSQEDIQKLESGQAVSAMELVVGKIEMTLGVQLLRYNSKLSFGAPKEKPFGDIPVEVIEEPVIEKKSIFKKLFSRKKKVEEPKQEVEEELEELVPEKKETFEKISSGKIDFSKRKDLHGITLKDLAELKRRKEKGEMFGDEVELEEKD